MLRIIFAFLVSLCCISFAFAENEDNEVKAKAVAPVDWATITVNYEDITYPWTISVPAPGGIITSVTGPCGASYTQWYIQNGTLYITINGSVDVQFQEGGTFCITFIVGPNYTPYHVSINIIP